MLPSGSATPRRAAARDEGFVDFVSRMTDAVVQSGAGRDAVALLLKLTEGGSSPRLVVAVLDGLVRGSEGDEAPWPSPRLSSALRTQTSLLSASVWGYPSPGRLLRAIPPSDANYG